MAKTALKWGFITALFSFLWITLEYAVGLQTDYIAFHPVITLLALIIPLICMYYGLREEKRKDPLGFPFSKGLLTGLLISGVAALFGVAGQWIFHSWVNPDFFSTMITYAESKALARGVDVLVAREEAMAYFNIKSYLAQSVGGALLGGAVAAAILAFFMRTRTTT